MERDEFEVYIMYRPDVQAAIWVPVGLMKWGWKGTAESADTGITWKKTAGQHDKKDPAGVPTTHFPEWKQKATEDYPRWVWDQAPKEH